MAQQTSNMVDEQSMKWEIKQKCQVYDEGKKQWIDGEVIDIFKDDEGEWVIEGQIRQKEIGIPRR